MNPDLRRSNPKVLCAFTLTVVFLCGTLAGALAMTLGAHKTFHRASFFTDAGKAAYLEQVKKDLNLTPAQAEQMESILDDFSTYYRNVVADGKSRIMQILNDDQRRKFEQMLAERQKSK
jgi:Spy/CpxP family protein refolding chaperone